MTLELRNPHAVLAALRARPQDVHEIRSAAGSGPWAELEAEARRRGVSVVAAESGRGKARPGRDAGGRALVKERAATPLAELFAGVAERSLFLALDQIQDPQNLGAIFRAAAFFRVAGVVMPAERAAPLSGVAYDVASGGLETVPFAREASLRHVLERAREAGLWLLGTSEHAETPLQDVPRDRPWLIVLGNEARGLRRLTAEQCDMVCTIPRPDGPDDPSVTSLNVSVSAGIVLALLSR